MVRRAVVGEVNGAMKGMGIPEVVAVYLAIAVGLVIAGWGRFQINGRRFRRRTIGGGQRFPSYGSAVFTQLWEAVAMSAANLMILAALLIGVLLAIWLVRFW